jgi:hypothetical protein
LRSGHRRRTKGNARRDGDSSARDALQFTESFVHLATGQVRVGAESELLWFQGLFINEQLPGEGAASFV